MAFPLFRRNRGGDTIGSLYGAIVAQARHPVFYAECRIPDTVQGRFDMIVLHVALLFRRLRTEAEPLRALGQGVFDRFCRDMEESLREMSVSDLSIPKEMRRIGEAFYGRAAGYERALAIENDDVLEEALRRNVWAGANAPGAPRLAAYVRAAVDALAAQDAGELGKGMLRFPAPLAAEAVAARR